MINVRHYSNPEQYAIYLTEESIPVFTELMQRALNCWPDAHPAIKELGDMFTHGKILQDYYIQRTDGGSDGHTNFKALVPG